MTLLFQVWHGLAGISEVDFAYESPPLVILFVLEVGRLSEEAHLGVYLLELGHEETTAEGKPHD